MATINSSTYTSKAKVEIYNNSTLVQACTCGDTLQSFTVDRDENNNKFFGFGICQSLKVQLIDLERELTIEKGFKIEPIVDENANDTWKNPYPTFYADDIVRDEETNSITATCFDLLYKASSHSVSELALEPPYSISDIATACRKLLGLSGMAYLNITGTNSPFSTVYPEGANFSGNETIRDVLNAIAEATQTIYYLDEQDRLIFRRLSTTEQGTTIDKSKYFSLKSGAARTIGAICHATELGDNVISGDANGLIQYVRDNPFWSNREDIGALLDAAMAAVEGLTIQEFICEDWEGSFSTPIGGRIRFEAEDGSYFYSYLLNDIVTFDGTFSQNTQWKFEPNDNETAANPTSIGEKLNQAYARVDKVNKQIDIVAGESSSNKEAIAALQINTNSISASVTTVSNELNDKVDSLNDEVGAVRTEVSAFKQTSSEALLEFKTTVEENGVTKVDTGTGFTFNSEGLTINKTDSEITTQITEDGMAISKSGEEVLVANNQGVKAEDLHATTFLIIGNNSRFEDWNGRTACFWIGG